MKFFYNPDWFNRPGPWAFTLEHFLFIIFTVLVGITVSLILRKNSQKTIKIVLISLWAFIVALEILKWNVIYIRVFIDETYPFDIETMLPLHSCSMFMYIFPIAMFSKNHMIKKAANNFLVTVNMIMGFITLFVGFAGKHASLFSFFGFHTLIYHAIIFIVPLIMVITNYYDVKKDDLKYGLALFGILTLIVLAFDSATGCDYMYFYDGHTFGVLRSIYENVHRSIWTLIVVTCYILTALITHYLIVGVKYLIHRNKGELSSDEN